VRNQTIAWAAGFFLVAAVSLTTAALRTRAQEIQDPHLAEPTPALQQEPSTPEPTTPPVGDAEGGDIVPTADGGHAVLVEVPKSLPRGEVREAAQHQEDTLEHVANGNVSMAEATRDPDQSTDPGSGIEFWLLAALFGGLVRPPVDYAVERSRLDTRLGAAVHLAALVGFYLLLWALLHKSNPGLPQDWTSWLIAAGVGGGAGAAGQSSIRTLRGRDPADGAGDPARGQQEGRQ
jgi:hypothetical protein